MYTDVKGKHALIIAGPSVPLLLRLLGHRLHLVLPGCSLLLPPLLLLLGISYIICRLLVPAQPDPWCCLYSEIHSLGESVNVHELVLLGP